jgi:hypothetical protein
MDTRPSTSFDGSSIAWHPRDAGFAGRAGRR